MKQRTQFQKCISLLLALVLVSQCCVVMPISTSAATYAEATGRLNLGEGIVGYQQTLNDNGDGTFSLTLTLEDASSLEEAS